MKVLISNKKNSIELFNQVVEKRDWSGFIQGQAIRPTMGEHLREISLSIHYPEHSTSNFHLFVLKLYKEYTTNYDLWLKCFSLHKMLCVNLFT